MNYYDRLTTILLAEAKLNSKVKARVKKIQAARRSNEGPNQRIPSDGMPRPGSGEPLPDTYAAVGPGRSGASVNDPGMQGENPTTTTRRKFKA
jgi:hypothetical protein